MAASSEAQDMSPEPNRAALNQDLASLAEALRRDGELDSEPSDGMNDLEFRNAVAESRRR